MPAIVYHLYVAKKYAERHPEFLASPEYYLGHVAPDAALTRPGNNSAIHAVTHLKQEGVPWEQSVLDSLHTYANPSVYLQACHMHVFIDVVFYGRLDTDGKNSGTYGQVMDLLDRKLLAMMPDYPDIADLIANAKPVDAYPGTTAEDLENEVAACRDLVKEIPESVDDIPDPEGFPLQKLLGLTDPIVEYLEVCFSK